jgi:hypothetical protein
MPYSYEHITRSSEVQNTQTTGSDSFRKRNLVRKQQSNRVYENNKSNAMRAAILPISDRMTIACTQFPSMCDFCLVTPFDILYLFRNRTRILCYYYYIVPLIDTVLLLGAPMLPTRWVKISTYLQSETFLSDTLN